MKQSPGADLMQAMPQPMVDPDDDQDAQAHQDLSNIVKAHAVKTSPDRLAKVHELAGRHKAALKGLKAPKMKSVDDLKAYNQNQFGGPGGKPKDGF